MKLDLKSVTPTEPEAAKLDAFVDEGLGSYYDARVHYGLEVEPPKDVINRLSREQNKAAGRAGLLGVFCGDCLRQVNQGDSCAHLRVGKRGGRYYSDDSRF